MYRLWGKKIKNHKIIASADVKSKENISQDDKKFKCIGAICKEFDLSMPLWLDKHTQEFAEFKQVIFYPDDFIDDIDFDKLEIDLIDDDSKK